MQYDFVPLPERKPLKWPNGARIAIIFTLNFEFWDIVKDTSEPYYAGGPPALPDPVPGNVVDWPNYSWREYGQRVGIWRLISSSLRGTLRTADIIAEEGLIFYCDLNRSDRQTPYKEAPPLRAGPVGQSETRATSHTAAPRSLLRRDVLYARRTS